MRGMKRNDVIFTGTRSHYRNNKPEVYLKDNTRTNAYSRMLTLPTIIGLAKKSYLFSNLSQWTCSYQSVESKWNWQRTARREKNPWDLLWKRGSRGGNYLSSTLLLTQWRAYFILHIQTITSTGRRRERERERKYSTTVLYQWKGSLARKWAFQKERGFFGRWQLRKKGEGVSSASSSVNCQRKNLHLFLLLSELGSKADLDVI